MPTGNRKEYVAKNSPLRRALEGDIKRLRSAPAQTGRVGSALNNSTAKSIAGTLNRANRQKK